MHDLIVALVFIGIVALPCVIAARSGNSSENEA